MRLTVITPYAHEDRYVQIGHSSPEAEGVEGAEAELDEVTGVWRKVKYRYSLKYITRNILESWATVPKWYYSSTVLRVLIELSFYGKSGEVQAQSSPWKARKKHWRTGNCCCTKLAYNCCNPGGNIGNGNTDDGDDDGTQNGNGNRPDWRAFSAVTNIYVQFFDTREEEDMRSSLAFNWLTSSPIQRHNIDDDISAHQKAPRLLKLLWEMLSNKVIVEIDDVISSKLVAFTTTAAW
ncbi:hypothetical protein ANCCEY_07690 [Ancylostoma ceylanicum]|uniref:Uncharacterized protein n=1 Tax=Ancylostoma ceylanicum TaxID=53326 RepID=A0A0D6LMZ0_9BILA|nr:hypothetical protein ANCCEY_07690 [Ancylostoma ceylanicum]